MLTYGKTNCIKVHVLDNKLFTELISEKLCDLHIDTEVLITLSVLEGSKRCVCCNNELILCLIKLCACSRNSYYKYKREIKTQA